MKNTIKQKIYNLIFRNRATIKGGSELSNSGPMLPLQPLVILTLAGFQSTEFERSPSLQLNRQTQINQNHCFPNAVESYH